MFTAKQGHSPFLEKSILGSGGKLLNGATALKITEKWLSQNVQLANKHKSEGSVKRSASR